MGVMRCSRNNCSGVMCSTYIDDVGYICYECQNEFKELTKDTKETENEFRRELKLFIKSYKHIGYSNNMEEITVEEFFNNYTK